MSKLKFALGTKVFETDDIWLSYKSGYGKSFRVQKSEITGVSIDQSKRGKGMLKINGSGTSLAEVDLPKPWAEKAQEFILREIGKL